MNATPIDQAKTELAYALGESPDKIKTMRADWEKYMRQGVIVKLHIRRWRAKAKLDFADLGLHDIQAGEADELMQLGEKYLLPQRLIRELDSIETSARANIEKHCFKTYWGDFIPAKSYLLWKEENELWKSRYFALRDKIEQEYEANKVELLLAYRKAAAKAYQRMKALTPDKMSTTERLDQEYFIARFNAQIDRLIPNRYAIYDSFAFDEELEFIPLPALIAEENATAQLIQSKADTELATERAKRAGLIDMVNAQEQMNKDIIQKAAAKKEALIDNFLIDIQAQIRGLIYEAATGVLASIKRNGNLQPRSVVQLQNLVTRLSNLNFLEDRDTDRIINRIQQIMEQSIDTRRASLENIETTLADIATITRGALLAIGETPRSPKGTSLQALGLTDNPPAEMIRKARQRLEIEPTLELPDIARANRI